MWCDDDEQEESLVRKFDLDTLTVDPIGAEDGLSVIDGDAVVVVKALTVKVAEAKSPTGLPVAVTL